jgi:hypothetical protein
LAATAQGGAALNQPIEMVDRNAMQARAATSSARGLAVFQRAPRWEPTFVFRLGYAADVAQRSPRRPFSDVVRS